MKKSERSEKRFLVLAFVSVIIIAVCWLSKVGLAENTTKAWVMCQPKSYVHCRALPSGRSKTIGRFDCGDDVLTDGKKKNGFVHLVHLSFEESEGWIYGGYLVYEEPVRIDELQTINSGGRVHARKTVNGKHIRWLKNGRTLKVYWANQQWAVTSEGFVQSKYISGLKGD